MEELITNIDNIDNYVYPHDNVNLIFMRLITLIILTIGFCCLLLISLGTLIYSSDYLLLGISGSLCSTFFIVINLFLTIRSQLYLKFCKRYDKYMDLLNGQRRETIINLAEFSNNTKNRVIKDLNFAIKQKLIPYGHFNDDKSAFITYEERM